MKFDKLTYLSEFDIKYIREKSTLIVHKNKVSIFNGFLSSMYIKRDINGIYKNIMFCKDNDEWYYANFGGDWFKVDGLENVIFLLNDHFDKRN